MANRFAIDRQDGFTLIQFGLVSKTGLLLDRLTCVFPDPMLETQRENLVQYSDGIGNYWQKIATCHVSCRCRTAYISPVVTIRVLAAAARNSNVAALTAWFSGVPNKPPPRLLLE
jgi:hypothetical protein